MARFLITLSLGPVQSLIADARRTRDLWCGSWLLSEAARAAARVLHTTQPGCLIFPCPDDSDEELKPQDEPREGANIGNVLRAEVPLENGAAARALCDDARSAAIERVRELGERARERLRRPVRADVWEAQIDDILEGFAAWVEIGADHGYVESGKRLGATLSARKATRNFRSCKPPATTGLPKSSLDGARETVLPDWPAGERARAMLALSRGEQLDALGVIKRLAGDVEQFTAWSRIAADPWIERLTSDQRQRLKEAYDPLVDQDLATRVRGNGGAYKALPFDGQFLYRFRLENALTQSREALRGEADSAATQKVEPLLKAFEKRITTISRERADDAGAVGVPVPYAAILKADGDRMGMLLGKAENAGRSRDISRALHKFASSVRLVVRRHRGHAVYAGGDDVLALVPLQQALDCARTLAEQFAESLAGIARDMKLPDNERPTLSVGLGIGHVIEPLGTLRDLADRAEQQAKGDATETPRDALAIRLRIRSGGELAWRARWKDTKAFRALERFIGAYRMGELPARAAYDLRAVDRRLAWLRGSDSETARGMRNAEVERMLDRARRAGGSEAVPAELRSLIRERADEEPLAELADAMIIARWLSARTAADLQESS